MKVLRFSARGSNPGPSAQQANVLTTRPPCCLIKISIHMQCRPTPALTHEDFSILHNARGLKTQIKISLCMYARYMPLHIHRELEISIHMATFLNTHTNKLSSWSPCSTYNKVIHIVRFFFFLSVIWYTLELRISYRPCHKSLLFVISNHFSYLINLSHNQIKILRTSLGPKVQLKALCLIFF